MTQEFGAGLRTVTLELSYRKYRNPQVYEHKVRPHQRAYRQCFITDLGHDEPTILLTNDASSTTKPSSPATPSA